VKIENGAEATPTNNEDTEMGDGSMAASDDDDGDDGEGDDGEDDEGSVDNQNSPSKPLRPASPIVTAATGIKTVPSLGFGDTPMTGLEFPRPHPTIQIERTKLEGQSGSPLKNVALTTSALTSPLESPTVAAPFSDFGTATAPQLDPVPEAVKTDSPDEEMLLKTAASAPSTLPAPPPEPTATEANASAEVLREEGGEEMLLDIVDNANNSQIGGPEVPIAAPEITPEQVPIPQTEAPVEATLDETVEATREEEAEDPVLLENAETEAVPQVQNAEEDDDGFPDLLGGLEKSLEKPEQSAPAPEPAPAEPEVKEVEEKAETVEPVEQPVEAQSVPDAAEAEKKEEA